MALTPEQLAEIQRLRALLQQPATNAQRRAQAIFNAEKAAGQPVRLPTDKSEGGEVEYGELSNRFSKLINPEPKEPTLLERATSAANAGLDAAFPVRKIGRVGIEAMADAARAMRAQAPARYDKELRSFKSAADEGARRMQNGVRNKLGLDSFSLREKKSSLGSVNEGSMAKAEGGSMDLDAMRLALMNKAKPKVKKVKEPTETVKAYKLFRVDPKKPGQLFPLFVDANTPVTMNQWVDAKEGDMKDGKVKSKIGALAYRPGWHAGDLPIATHIGEKSDSSLTAPDQRPANHAWAEVEMPHDVDWQSEATKRGTNKDGKLVPVKAHITDQIPKGGHYRYKTNPNMTGNWLIGGSMKVNKVLTDKEVERINKKAGMSDLPRAQPFNKKTFGFAHGGITHAHHLDIEERPL